MLWAQSTTNDYIRAEGDFDTEINYVDERTSKAAMRAEEQSEKAESFRENLWKGIQLKGT